MNFEVNMFGLATNSGSPLSTSPVPLQPLATSSGSSKASSSFNQTTISNLSPTSSFSSNSVNASSNSFANSNSNSVSMMVVDELPFECTEADVLALLQPFGRVRSLNLNRHPQKRSVYCICDFTSSESAQLAAAKLDNFYYFGRKLRAFLHNSTIPPAQSKQGNSFGGAPQSRFVRTAQVHISYLSKQLGLVVNENFLRDIFSNFGDVLEVSLKKICVDQEMCIQNGYGFVHFPLTNEGIKSAFHAVEALHQVTINQISYDCSVSNQLRQVLAQMDRDPTLKQQVLSSSQATGTPSGLSFGMGRNAGNFGNNSGMSSVAGGGPFAGANSRGTLSSDPLRSNVASNYSSLSLNVPPRSPFPDGCNNNSSTFGVRQQQQQQQQQSSLLYQQQQSLLSGKSLVSNSSPVFPLSGPIPSPSPSISPPPLSLLSGANGGNNNGGSYHSNVNSFNSNALSWSMQSAHSQSTTPPTPTSLSSFGSGYASQQVHQLQQLQFQQQQQQQQRFSKNDSNILGSLSFEGGSRNLSPMFGSEDNMTTSRMHFMGSSTSTVATSAEHTKADTSLSSFASSLTSNSFFLDNHSGITSSSGISGLTNTSSYNSSLPNRSLVAPSPGKFFIPSGTDSGLSPISTLNTETSGDCVESSAVFHSDPAKLTSTSWSPQSPVSAATPTVSLTALDSLLPLSNQTPRLELDNDLTTSLAAAMNSMLINASIGNNNNTAYPYNISSQSLGGSELSVDEQLEALWFEC